MPDTLRLELRVSPEWLAALDDARGYEPRASYVKRVVLSAAGSSDAAEPIEVLGAVPGALHTEHVKEKSRPVDRDAKPTELPKVAKRR